MKIVSLNCNNCGAPLEASRKARFVTCTFCDARLEIKQEGAAAWTEVLEDLRTEVRKLQRRSDLEQLDREWERERQEYMVRGKHGHVSAPSKAGAVLPLIFVVPFGLFWTGMASSMNAPSLFPLFGILFIVFAIAMAMSTFSKAQQLEEARNRYQSRRRKLMREANEDLQETAEGTDSP